jgi:ATP-binding cassette subfamily F protein uup
MDRLCTEVVGLDGRGGSAVYASVGQWLDAYERAAEEESRPAAPPAPRRAASPPPPPKPRKLGYRDQQELAGMEGAILAAEQAVTDREADVQQAAAAGHVALAAACRALDSARAEVERLYARWQELEARRGPA